MSFNAKIFCTWVGIFLFRFLLLPVRVPNIEPLTAAVMPVSGRANTAVSVLFALTSIVLYDAITAGIGTWTIAPAFMYAGIAIAAGLYFRRYESTRMHFLGFGVVATLVYDFVTGPLTIPFFEHVPFMQVLAAQVPFTLLHLAGTVLFALTLSPVLAKYLKAPQVAEATENAHQVA